MDAKQTEDDNDSFLDTLGWSLPLFKASFSWLLNDDLAS